MVKKLAATDFFKKKSKITDSNVSEKTKQEATNVESVKENTITEDKKTDRVHDVHPIKHSIELEENLVDAIADARAFLTRTEHTAFANELERICTDAARERFTVSVVGEFSKGKSTFVNALLGKPILPVGDLPTTAMLTRIRYSEKEVMVHFGKDGKKMGTYPVSQKSWAGLTAENFGAPDPTGTVLVGCNNPWLREYCLEINDTPGAGDLEDDRAMVIGDALARSDGAIITTSALAAMSMSEKLFIEQRLIAKKTPFLMIIVTKLDQVPKKQRSKVVEYVINRLKLWNMDIPVYVPYDVEMPDDEYESITGMDKVKNQIVKWMRDPERIALTESWIREKTLGILDNAIGTLEDRLAMCDQDEEKRAMLIQEKKDKLNDAKFVWEDLRVQMLQRCNNCYNFLRAKAEDGAVTSRERLQYEASHAQNPERWWREDYPYRVKIELSNMASNIDAHVTRMIADDARWFNSALDKNFKTQVLHNKETIVDKSDFASGGFESDLKLSDINKGRAIAKIGSTALSIGCSIAMTCAGLGMYGIVATLGLGTGTSLVSDSIFKSKIEKQREMLKGVVAQHVDSLVETSLADSERKLKSVYNDIINEATNQEKTWVVAQEDAIEKSVAPFDERERDVISEQIDALNKIREKLLKI